jgi:hypothetical protein
VRAHFAFTLVLIVAAYSLFSLPPSEAQSFGAIHIRSNGSIEPSSAPISIVGDRYSLSDNLYNSPIILERNNVIFDGGGYALESAGKGIALNITCSNVTVRSSRVLNWEVGILGVYNNVTIQNCYLIGNQKAIAIYADNYNVTGNYIAQSTWGIRVNGNNNVFSENHIANNSIGIWTSLNGAGMGNTIVSNIIEVNEQIAIETDYGGGFEVYHNNFIIKNNHNPIVSTAYLAVPGDETKVVMSSWDNGKEGNYWSNYAAEYPNATEIGSTGVYDTPYVINIAPNLTDRYPLTQPINISEVHLPTPLPSALVSPSPTATASPIKSQNPSASPTSIVSPSSSQEPIETVKPTKSALPNEVIYGTTLAIFLIAIFAVVITIRRRKQPTLF